MASMLGFAVYSAQETAKEAKTKQLIAKLDAIIKNRWEQYRTRRVPILIPPGTPPLAAAQMRLKGLQELMRFELPDRWSDIAVVPTSPTPTSQITIPVTQAPLTTLGAWPSTWQSYWRRVQAVATSTNGQYPSLDYQGAECLYLIVNAALAEEGDAREVFKAGDVADVDNDGFPEFIDAWGKPIRFIRWPAGFISDLSTIANGQVVSYKPGKPADPGDPTAIPPIPPSPPEPPLLTARNDSNKTSIAPNPISSFSANGTKFTGAGLYFGDNSTLPDYSVKITGYTYGTNSGTTVTFTLYWDNRRNRSGAAIRRPATRSQSWRPTSSIRSASCPPTSRIPNLAAAVRITAFHSRFIR